LLYLGILLYFKTKAKENVILDLYFKTDSAEKSLTGLFGKMDAVDNSAEQLNKSFQTASKGIADSVTTSAKAVTNFNETVKGGADGLKQLATAKKAFTDISMMESVNEVEKLSAELTGVLTKSKEFNQVTKRVQQEFKKGTIDEAQALKILEDAINKGVDATRKMQTETDKVVTKTKSYRAEIQELKTLLRQPGLSGEQYVQAQTRLAQVTDAMGDQQAQIKLLASDTRGLDTAMQGLTIGVSVFASLQGASALFGSENEQVQKALLKVTAAMSLLQGLQQIQNTLDTESGFVNSVKLYWSDLTGKSLASQAVAQRIATGATELDIVANEGDIAAKSGNTIATTVYGYALTAVTAIARVTGLSMAASWAIATAGLTLLITAVVLLIANYEKLGFAVVKLTNIEKARLEIKQATAKANVEEKVSLESLLFVAKDETLAKEDRLKAIKRLNEISPEYLGNLTLENINTGKSTDAIKSYIKALDAKSTAEAIQSKIVELKKKLIDEENKGLDEQATVLNKLKSALITGITGNSVLGEASLIESQTKNLAKNTSEIQKQIQAYQILQYEKLKTGEIEIDSSSGKSNKEATVKIDKLKIQPKNIELINIELLGADDTLKEKLQDELINFSLLITPDMSLVDLNPVYDRAMQSMDNIRNMANNMFGNISQQYGPSFARMTEALSFVVDIKLLKEQLVDQQRELSIAQFNKLEAVRLNNISILQAEQQLTEALKSEDKKRIEEATKIVETTKKKAVEVTVQSNKSVEVAGDKIEQTKGKLKQEQAKVAVASLQFIGSIVGLIEQSVDRQIANIDRLIAKQQEAVDRAREIANKGNSQLLDAENKKLEKLEELRRRQQAKKKAFAITQAIINTAIAVTAALTETPPYNYVLAAISAAAGAVQIGVISAQQFKQGGQTPYGLIDAPSHENGGGKFSIRGRKDYVGEYEGGEYIFDRQTSAMNKDVFDVIRKHKINLSDVLANNSLKGFNFNPILSSTMVNQNGELESRLDAIEKAVLSLPDKMPRATFNADMYGLSMTVRETQIKETNWKR